jgi:hypothetical protein
VWCFVRHGLAGGGSGVEAEKCGSVSGARQNPSLLPHKLGENMLLNLPIPLSTHVLSSIAHSYRSVKEMNI